MLKAKNTNTRLPRQFCKASMEELYARFNRRDFIHPDPLEFVYQYSNPLDREIVGLIASSLAYGRVAQILRSVARAIEPMGGSPSEFVLNSSHRSLQTLYGDFKHRFTTGEEIVSLLTNTKRILERYGSLQRCFLNGLGEEDKTVLPALTAFVKNLSGGDPARGCMLLPSPQKGSACKRFNLFLRWMVRKDDVDPGVWTRVSPSALIIPLDTHMHRFSLRLGLTTRRQADIRTAMEITRAFMSICPDDPVRYDFALTRLGIRPKEEPLIPQDKS